ncbi:MAG: BLUF domain-containing protein [Methylococcaceae bacterium]|nr:BLUF domain-containing protein [Methylococcaceae bacterium]
MSLYCLIYTSIASQKMTDEELKAILQKARPHNCQLQITGMLLYKDPFFMQILEGEEDIIDQQFTRIAKDSRHHKVSLIYKNAIDERSFANWTMGFNKISRQHIDSTRSSNTLYNNCSVTEQSKVVTNLLEMFKNETLF